MIVLTMFRKAAHYLSLPGGAMKIFSFKKTVMTVLAISIACSVPVLVKEGVSAAATEILYSETALATTEDAAIMSSQVVDLVNLERSKAGLPPLTVDPALTAATSIRSVELETSFSHTRPNGTSCFTAITNSFYTLLGENIAAGYPTADSVMEGWMNSAGHRDNILSSRFTSIGVSCYYSGGGCYWVQLFGEDPEISYDAPSGIQYEMTGSACSVIGFYPAAGFGGSVSVPGSYGGSSVTSISQDAFQNEPSLTSVTISNAITSVGSSAFKGSQSLKTVTLSNNLTSIASYTFNNCSSLSSLSIPEKVKTIGYGAFANCGNLSYVVFRGKVDSIDDYAFKLSSTTGKKLTAFVPAGTKDYYAGLLTGNAIKNITVTICEVTVVSALSAKPLSYNSIGLQWTSSGTSAGFAIYRSTSSSGTYSFVNTTTSKSYTDTGLSCGTTYFYKVKPYNLVGTQKIYGNPSAAASAKPAVAVPTGLAAVGASSCVKLTWKAVPYANGYSIYRSAVLAGTYTKIASTTCLEYKNTGLTAGKTYYYKVKAYRTVSSVPMYGNPTGAVSAKAK